MLETINASNIAFTPQEILIGFNLYLDMINKEEVGFARKIIISDRTELNINHDIYTTVY